jgi:hypothetical protein
MSSLVADFCIVARISQSVKLNLAPELQHSAFGKAAGGHAEPPATQIPTAATRAAPPAATRPRRKVWAAAAAAPAVLAVVVAAMATARKDRSPLLYFYGVECSHCDLMDPLIRQLEDETGMTLRKFEVWYNDDNLRLLQRLDRDGVCNGVPFFYSKVKRDWICGATIYPNFKAWALNKPHERFLAPPTEESEVVGQFKGIFDRIKTEGFQKMRERMEAGKKRAGEMPPEKKARAKAGAFIGNANLPAATASTVARRSNASAFDAYAGVMMPASRATCGRRP